MGHGARGRAGRAGRALAVALALSAGAAWAASLVIGNFEAGDLSGWQEKEFKGKTRYRIAEVDGRRALVAESNGAASGLFKEVKVDLERTPYLTWSWRVEGTLPGLDEKTRGGDDYVARIYVVVSGGALFWRTRALNYVWSSNQPVGASWPNAFTANSVMLAVQSGPEKAGRWVTQTRNVREDLKRYIGRDVQELDAVALMTDTDNSGRRAIAEYGAIRFSSEPPPEQALGR